MYQPQQVRNNGHMPPGGPRPEMAHQVTPVTQPPLELSTSGKLKNFARRATLEVLGRGVLPYALTVTAEEFNQGLHFLPGLNLPTHEMIFIYGPLLGVTL